MHAAYGQSVVVGEGSTFVVDYHPLYNAEQIAVMDQAAQYYADFLSSSVPVTVFVDAQPQMCSGGYNAHTRTKAPKAAINFANAPQADVWYPSALANAYAGEDLFPADYDIVLTYNRNMLFGSNCQSWYLGDDMAFDYDQLSLKYETLQELAHGLGLFPLANLSTGELLEGKPDVYTQNLSSYSLAQPLTALTDADRKSTLHTIGDLIYTGSKGLQEGLHVNNMLGINALLMMNRSYDAPSMTASHLFDGSTPLQLMNLTLRGDTAPELALADAMLEDLGWQSARNKPAVVLGQNPVSIQEDSQYSVSLNDLIIEDEAPESLQLSLSAGAHYQVNGLQITPDTDFNGTLNVGVEITDDAGHLTHYTAQVEVLAVNDAPVILAQRSLSLLEDGTMTLSLADITTQDVDSEQLTLSILDGADYQYQGLTLTPNADFHGTLNVNVGVSDGELSSEPFTLNVNVIAVNDAPVIVGQVDVTTEEETALALTTDLLMISDADSSSFSLEWDAGEHYQSVAGGIVPEQNFAGTLSVPVRVNDGELSSNTYTLNVTVLPKNDPPVILSQQAIRLAEDTQRELSSADFSVEDADGDTVSIELLAGEHYQVAGNTLIPAADFFGELSVAVRAFDGQEYSDVFMASVTVTPVNDAPVLAVAQPLSMLEDDSLLLTLDNLNIVDPDSNEFTLNIAQGEHYQVAFNEIIPAANWFGTLEVLVNVNDGELDSNPLTLYIDVHPVNDLPELQTDTLAQVLIYRSFAQALLATDIDGDTLSFSLDNAPAWLTVSAQGELSGMPESIHVGEQSLAVRVSDGTASVSYPLSITVLNDPTASDLHSELSVERTIWSTSGWVPVTATLVNHGPKAELAAAVNVEFSGEWYSDDERCDAVNNRCDLNVTDQASVLFYVRQDQAGSTDLRLRAAHEGFEVDSSNNAASLTLTFTDASPTSPQFTVPSFGEGTVRAIGMADIQGGRWPEILFANGPTEASTAYRFEKTLFTPVLHSHLSDASDSYAMALFDADNDGDIDWVLANGNGEPNTVYLNDGTGRFELVGLLGNADSRDVAFADIDKDGDIDLVFANNEQDSKLYWNDGKGNFTEGTNFGANGAVSVVIKDLNRDGHADILFANRGFRNRLFLNSGNSGAHSQRSLVRSGLAESSGSDFGMIELGDESDQTSRVELADFDGDGDATDIVFVNDASTDSQASVEVYQLNASALPELQIRNENSSVQDIAVGDYDGDGRDDLALLRPGGALEVVAPEGEQLTLVEVMDTDGADTIMLVDVDGSGQADVISASSRTSRSRLDYTGDVVNAEALNGEDDNTEVTLSRDTGSVASTATAGAGLPWLSLILLALVRRRQS